MNSTVHNPDYSQPAFTCQQAQQVYTAQPNMNNQARITQNANPRMQYEETNMHAQHEQPYMHRHHQQLSMKSQAGTAMQANPKMLNPA